MSMISFILNLPWTLLGLLVGVVSIPVDLQSNRRPLALVFNVKSFWWYTWQPKMKGARAMAIGHVVLLGPNVLEHDLEHELIHVEQAVRIPLIHPILYTIESFRKGYRENKYEKEAYGRAGNLYIENNQGSKFPHKKMKRNRAVGIVLRNDEVLLMQRRLNGKEYFVFPGGGVEAGENVEDAVLRELLEETTIKASINKLLYKVVYPEQKDAEHFFYLCSHISGEPQLGEGNEKQEMEAGTGYFKPLWVPVSDLSSMTIYPLEVRDWFLKDLESNFNGPIKEAVVKMN